jgi:hypothetical protein
MPTIKEQTMTGNEETCHFCGRQIESTQAAARAGWEPYFWDEAAGVEVSKCVCPACVDAHLEVDEEGEFVLRRDGNDPCPNASDWA